MGLKSTCLPDRLKKAAEMVRFFGLAAFILGFGFLISCQDPVEEKCLKICNKVIECAASDQSEELQSRIRISCMDGCTIHQADILECYSENMDCKTTGECMFNAIMSQY